MKLSVNILTWNTYPTTKKCLEILKKDLKGIEHEIIIIDNGSTDGCQDIATISNKKNMGISIGKNQGIDASKGEYIFMIDGDVIAVPNSVNCLLDYLGKNTEKYAIGFYSNKWTNQENKGGQKHHEDYCYKLFEPREYTRACIYYGMFRRDLFDKGIRFDTSEVFGEMGYGWEDMDFFEQMKKRIIPQYVAGINNSIGKYFHDINSSVRLMGHDEYMRTSKLRAEYFRNKWSSGNA